MLTLVLVAIVVENGWPFGEFYRAKRARAREIRERQALYVRAGLDEYDAKARAEKELATEAKATLAALQ